MKKISYIALSIIALFITLNITYSSFNTTTKQTDIFHSKNYIFKLNANGGAFTKSDNTKIVSGSVNLPQPTRTGYTFLGYSNSSNGSVLYSLTTNKLDEIQNKLIYAIWKINTYTITYNLNGGTISGQKTNYNVEESFKLVNPTRTGYTFTGWTGSNGNTASTSVTIPKGTIGDKVYNANWKTINYSISYDLAGGSISSQPTGYNIESNKITLPQPTRTGYTFSGWTGTGLSSPTKSVSIPKGSTGNRSYKATWSKNYYTVNYYINGSLWAQRSVGYGDSLENLNGQSALDGYHTFHGWSGWVNNMPNNNVNLYANVTESYCRLTTGHGPIGNANAILSVFQRAGWSGWVQEQTLYPGNYLVITDYTLTRAQAEAQKNFIASHTNYTNYNYPYLYWVAIDCTNGYSEAWTRGMGQSNFN